MKNFFDGNCAVREFTADGEAVGRCWFSVSNDYICPRHGNVQFVQEHYADTGQLTDEMDLVESQTIVAQ